MYPIYFSVCQFLFSLTMDHITTMTLLCLEQGNCSLKEHLEKFLGLNHLTTFLDDCLSMFLHAGLNTATRAQLPGEGPRGNFTDYVEWVLVLCGSSLTDGPVGDDTSPSQTPPRCMEHQPLQMESQSPHRLV